MNKELIKERFAKSVETYDRQACVQLHIAKTLAQIAVRILPPFCPSALEVGCGSGFLTRELLAAFSLSKLYLNDLVDEHALTLDRIFRTQDQYPAIAFLPGDAETIPFPRQLDAVFSASAIQWLADLPAFFAKVHTTLNRDGYFAFNTFGPGNIKEIRDLLGTGLAYPTRFELEEMLRQSFEVVEFVEENYISYYDSPRDVLRHLSETGVTATSGNFRWTKSRLAAFENTYREKYTCEGKVSLSWQVYYVVVCKRG